MDREKVIKEYEDYVNSYISLTTSHDYEFEMHKAVLALLKEQEAVVHPESSCEMIYITDCCCDLCGVQLIREDNFCRCCGKRIEWKRR